MDRVDAIIAFENGELDREAIIELFQGLVNDGSIWTLQGSYQRAARSLIDQGLVTEPLGKDAAPNPLAASLAEKMNPGRLRVSPRFHAVLAYLLGGLNWTKPVITSMYITSDGFIIANRGVLGTRDDLIQNINSVCEATESTTNEKNYLLRRVDTLQYHRY